MADGSVELFSFSLSTPVLDSQPVCGGRKFQRSFSKKDYPLLGEDNDERVKTKVLPIMDSYPRFYAFVFPVSECERIHLLERSLPKADPQEPLCVSPDREKLVPGSQNGQMVVADQRGRPRLSRHIPRRRVSFNS